MFRNCLTRVTSDFGIISMPNTSPYTQVQNVLLVFIAFLRKRGQNDALSHTKEEGKKKHCKISTFTKFIGKPFSVSTLNLDVICKFASL